MLIRSDDFAILFGVELGGELRGVHEITEHHGELPSFSLRSLRSLLFLDSRLLGWLSRARGHGLGRCSFTRPHEHLPVLISGELVDFDEFILQDVQGGVIEFELKFESPVRCCPSLLEKGNHLVEYRVEVHYRPSSSACNKALASFKSAVSNPSVN